MRFNYLRNEEKWKLWKKQHGRWLCKFCGTVMTDEPKRAMPFHGSSVVCDFCGGELTRRTGGGMGDKFNWILCNK